MIREIIGLALVEAFPFAVFEAQQDVISAEDFGTDWPFIFKEGYISYYRGNAITVMDSYTGRIYPVNGTAKCKVSALGLDDLAAVWLNYPEVDGAEISVRP